MSLVVAIIPGADLIYAQSYPTKPIRIVTGGVGGSSDVSVRLIAPGLTTNLGQQVIVDNRPGANSIIGTEIASRAPADGYT